MDEIMKKQIYTLKGLNFSYYATTAILLPYLPLYFQSEGFTSREIGILMMIGPFVAMFAQPFWGYVSDRLSKVKPIIFILWGLTILSSIGLFTTNGLSTAFLFVLLLYFFMMPSVPLLDSITITSTMQAGTTYGTVRSWGSFGFSSIAMVSGYLISRIGGTAHIGVLYWGLWVFPLLLLFFLQDEKVNGSRITLSSLKIVLQNRSFLWFLFMIFILIIPHRMNDSLFGLYLHHLGASDKWVGWAWALAALSEIPSFAFAGRFVQRFHELALLGVV
ncbi:MAG: MFS transporter, partial [Paenibacillus sp. RIFOXYA1_FULL_44_5]